MSFKDVFFKAKHRRSVCQRSLKTFAYLFNQVLSFYLLFEYHSKMLFRTKKFERDSESLKMSCISLKDRHLPSQKHLKMFGNRSASSLFRKVIQTTFDNTVITSSESILLTLMMLHKYL